MNEKAYYQPIRKEDLPEPIKVEPPTKMYNPDMRYILTDEEVEEFRKQNKEDKCPKIIGYEKIYEPVIDTKIKDNNNAK